MEPLLNEKVYTYSSKNGQGLSKAGLPLSTQSAYPVKSYFELLRAVAHLQFYNRRFRLLFRGQDKDYNTPHIVARASTPFRSNLYPSILRGQIGKRKSDILPSRFDRLFKAEELLKSKSSDGYMHKHKLIRWAMLQHYEVCPTPLLDVTYSLDVALSFAALSQGGSGNLFVLAIPQTSGPISTSLESGTQVIDLQQFCPPDVLRPHFQNGCLVGDYPIIDGPDDTHGGRRKGAGIGNNFACRLLAKFQLESLNGWDKEGFYRKTKAVLFPNKEDKWYAKMLEIKSAIE